MVLCEDGWKKLEKNRDSAEVKDNGMLFTIKEGEEADVPNDGFKEMADEMLKEIEEVLAGSGE